MIAPAQNAYLCTNCNVLLLNDKEWADHYISSPGCTGSVIVVYRQSDCEGNYLPVKRNILDLEGLDDIFK